MACRSKPGAAWTLVLLAVSCAGAWGDRNVYRLGATGGNSWEQALSRDPGTYLSVSSRGQRRLLPVETPGRYPTWQETLATFVDSVDGQWLRPFFVADTLNLARTGVRERVPARTRNLALSGYCWGEGIDRLLPMFDGDPTTATLFRIAALRDENTRSLLAQMVLVNLGTDYPVHRVRFFPRLGRENEHSVDLVSRMRSPRLDPASLDEQDFSENRLPWFEVAAAGAAAGLPAECWPPIPGRPLLQRIDRRVVNTTGDPRLTVVAHEPDYKRAIVDISFAPRPVQWIGVRPLDVLKDYEIAELQVFGYGHVPRSVYTTAVLDLGAPMAFGRIRWWGRRPGDAGIELRTRSGRDSDPLDYRVSWEEEDEYVPVSREEFLRAPADSRRLGPDRRNWSPWSAPYRWETGLDESLDPAAAWSGGTDVLSPGPARFVQLRLLFESTPEAAARMRNLDLEFFRPLVRDAVAEVWPLEAERGVRTTFTYSLAADLVDGDAFDRVELFTLIRADSVRSVSVDAAPLVVAETARIEDDRILAQLPRLEDGGDTDKLVEIVFDARVVQFGTEFLAWISDSREDGARQRVRPGDATDGYPGNRLGVRSTGLERGRLSRAQPRPNPFSPNGDGIRDLLTFAFHVYDVTDWRELRVTLHDLTGRVVRRLDPVPVRRGVYGGSSAGPTWDGTDAAGRRLPPGVYLYRITLEADTGPEVQVGTVALAY